MPQYSENACYDVFMAAEMEDFNTTGAESTHSRVYDSTTNSCLQSDVIKENPSLTWNLTRDLRQNESRHYVCFLKNGTGRNSKRGFQAEVRNHEVA